MGSGVVKCGAAGRRIRERVAFFWGGWEGVWVEWPPWSLVVAHVAMLWRGSLLWSVPPGGFGVSGKRTVWTNVWGCDGAPGLVVVLRPQEKEARVLSALFVACAQWAGSYLPASGVFPCSVLAVSRLLGCTRGHVLCGRVRGGLRGEVAIGLRT